MRFLMVTAAVAAGLLFAGASSARAQDDCFSPSTDGVYVYEHTEFRGLCTRYTTGAANLSGERRNDKASSIRIVGAYTAKVYEHSNRRGLFTRFHGTDTNFGDDAIRHDRASSIHVQRRFNACDTGNDVVVFENAACTGRASTITEDIPELARANVRANTITSVALKGDVALTLFRLPNFQGGSTIFTGADRNLDGTEVESDRASSVRIRYGRCDESHGIYLYQRIDFEGRCTRIRADRTNLTGEYVFNDAVSSIRLVGPYVATVFEHANFRGERSTYSSDDDDLRNDTVGNDRASSVRVEEIQNTCGFSLPGVYLHSGPGFTGRCTRFIDDTGDLGRYVIGADAARSVRVLGGYSARLFVDGGFSGSSSQFTADDADLGNNAIGNARASSIDVTGPEPEQQDIWRLQLRVTTADVFGAETRDDVGVSLNRTNHTWLDHGAVGSVGTRDFERGQTFTYDLLTDDVSRFNDIDWITLSKTGEDDWCVARVDLLINDSSEPAYSSSFANCRLLRTNDARSRNALAIPFDDLRRFAGWPEARSFLTDGLVLPREEIVGRVHSIVGDAIHATAADWDKDGSESVGVEPEGDDSLAVDLDLLARGGDVDIDVDFKLRFSCEVQEGTPTIRIAAEDFEVDVDFDFLLELIAFPQEGSVARQIRESLPVIAREIPVEPLDNCPRVIITDDGGVVFSPF